MTTALTLSPTGTLVAVKSEFAIALRGNKIADVTDEELDMAITGAISRGNLDLGLRNVDGDEVNYLCDQLCVIARKSFGQLTLDEIIAATSNGIHGKYDKERIYKPSVVLVVSWWKAYMTDALRIEAKVALEKQNAAPGPTKEEKQETFKRRIIFAFESYKKEGCYRDDGSLVFDLINKTGKIPFDDTRIEAIWQQARKQAIANLSRPVDSWGLRKSLKHALDALLLKGDETMILMEAKRITLYAFFDYLISIDADIIEFLKQ